MAVSETLPTRHYEPDLRNRTSLPVRNNPPEREDHVLSGSAETVDIWRMTSSLVALQPRFRPTPSILPPIEMWLLSSYQAESSLFDEAEFEVDIADAGLRTRHVTVRVVDRVTAPRSSSLTADEIALLLADDWQ